VGYWRPTGDFITFNAKAFVIATGGIGKSWLFTTNSWECTGDGDAIAAWAGADMLDMEFVQFHPTCMVWPMTARGILVTEGVRGDGGALRNSEGRRFMFDYIPPMFAAETADTEDEADRWYDDHTNNRRPPDLLPRDEVARSINSEVKAGRGSPHGGVFLDIATRRSPEYIRRRLPSMYHQFKELAGLDITAEPMEVAPFQHYMMGGIWVEADTGATTVPGLFAAGETAAGLHGANRLGGNSLSDLLVFGRRAGIAAADFVEGRAGPPTVGSAETDEIDEICKAALEPFGRESGESPYQVHRDLQETMQQLVGLSRTESELLQALEDLDKLDERARNVSVEGTPSYNPGWNLATDLPAMLMVSRLVAKAAIERRESRGGQTRDDFPKTDPELGKVNFIQRLRPDGTFELEKVPISQMPAELAALLEEEPK
jgi:succinate dehydrogenase / fumarate reductase flavoprotein subunit